MTTIKKQIGGNRRPQTFRNCEICGTKFGPLKRLSRRFCSKECGYLGRKTGGKKGKKYPHLQRARVGKCDVCKKEYRAVNDHKKRNQRFCSRQCFWIFWKKEIRTKMKKPAYLYGEENPEWKGDDAGYTAIHKWVRRKLGGDNKCQHCNRTDQKKYEWANIDHKYRRVLEDWMRLCTSCHRKHDNKWLR